MEDTLEDRKQMGVGPSEEDLKDDSDTWIKLSSNRLYFPRLFLYICENIFPLIRYDL